MLTDVLGGDASLAEPVERAARERVGAYIGLDVVSSVANDSGYGVFAAETRRCGSDLGCVRDRLIDAGLDHVLRVLVNTSMSPALVTLQLVSLSGDPRTKLEMLDDEGTIASATSSAAAELIESAGFVEGGRLEVEVVPGDARVRVTLGEESSEGLELRLAPGLYTVTAERAGYETASSEASVMPGGVQRVSLILKPESSWLESPWVWVGAGAVVAGVTVVLATALAAPRTYALCQTNTPALCD